MIFGSKTKTDSFVLLFLPPFHVVYFDAKMMANRISKEKMPRCSMPKNLTTLASAVVLVLLTSACVHRHRRSNVGQKQPVQTSGRRQARAPVAIPAGYSEEGVASWYGVPYHGRPAADGEIYDMETLVAAHRTIPFNTWLKVTNLANNETVSVRVIDRGPFVNGRILDLSKAAARSIHLLGPGIGQVRIEVIASPVDIPVNDFYAVQVGAFSNYESAERLRQQYAGRYGNAQLAKRQGAVTLWRVLVGKEPSVQAAQQLAVVLGAESKNVFVVRLDETVLKTTEKSGRDPARMTP